LYMVAAASGDRGPSHVRATSRGSYSGMNPLNP
jgi:hypothetical protein